MQNAPTTGQELRAEREAAELTQVQVAEQMGVSRTWIGIIEGRAVVRPKAVRLYREALRALASLREAV